MTIEQLKELRIGNLIIGNNGYIHKMSIDLFKNIEVNEWGDFIPITEEWLLENGFKEERAKCDGEFYQYRYPVMFGNESYVLRRNIVGQWLFTREDDSKKTWTLINIFIYIHNLQNIWFELNKEELKII